MKTEPGPAEYARAAWELHNQLAPLAERVETAKRAGKTEAEAWTSVVRSEPFRGAYGDALHRAICQYAADAVMERRRFRRSLRLATLALKVAEGRTSPEATIRAATRARGDERLAETGTLTKLKGAILKARNQRSRWQAAYNVLAWEADVWAVPDTARARKGKLSEVHGAAEARRWAMIWLAEHPGDD